jgi:hypothetical protein
MALKDNIMHVTTSREVSQRYRFLNPIVDSDEAIQQLIDNGYIEQWQAHLLWLVDIKKQSFTYIAKCTNCSRQYVHYAYLNVRRASELNKKKSHNLSA